MYHISTTRNKSTTEAVKEIKVRRSGLPILFVLMGGGRMGGGRMVEQGRWTNQRFNLKEISTSFQERDQLGEEMRKSNIYFSGPGIPCIFLLDYSNIAMSDPAISEFIP